MEKVLWGRYDVYSLSLAGEWISIAKAIRRIDALLLVNDINAEQRKERFPVRVEKVKRPWGRRGYGWQVFVYHPEKGSEVSDGRLYGYMPAFRLSRIVATALSHLKAGVTLHIKLERALSQFGFDTFKMKLHAPVTKTTEETAKSDDLITINTKGGE